MPRSGRGYYYEPPEDEVGETDLDTILDSVEIDSGQNLNGYLENLPKSTSASTEL